jgi:microcystin-dependent protein
MDFFLAQIILFAGNFVPERWMACNGQLLPIPQNTALFSLLGTQYGGDGVHNFALPNLPAPAGTPAGAPAPAYLICVEGVYPSRG